MNRLLCAAAATAVALMPLVVWASPSPSPTLDRVLVAPPGSNFVESSGTDTGVLEGEFGAGQYATGSSDPALVESTLKAQGFVTGYGRTWTSLAPQQVVVEVVIAFAGASGAQGWLADSELSDKADPTYKHSISITGIDSYYGAHFYDSSSMPVPYGDGFAFVKGNDYFSVFS